MSLSFPKKARLLHRSSFKKISREGETYVTPLMVIHYFLHSSHAQPRLGLTTSKKYGKAHERNRFRRIAREAFRHTREGFPPSIDLNIRPRSLAKSSPPCTKGDIEKDLKKFLSHLKKEKQKNRANNT